MIVLYVMKRQIYVVFGEHLDCVDGLDWLNRLYHLDCVDGLD